MRSSSGRTSWLVLLTWDGLLPAAVAALPAAAEHLLPKNDLAELFTVILAPIIAAMVRAVVGFTQLQRVAGNSVPLYRQIAMAVAIILLMVFEGFVAMLVFARDEPAAAWLVPACLFACYPILIVVALRPAWKSSVD